MPLSLIYCFVIIFCANEGFVYFASGERMADVGNLLILLGIVYFLIKKADIRILNNPITYLIILFLVLMSIQAALSSFYFNQGIVKGIIVSRHQFYYLSFILFVMFLDTTEKIEKMFLLLTIAAVIMFFYSLYLYMFTNLSHGSLTRSGIKRPIIAGIDLMGLLFFWNFSGWIYSLENKTKSASMTLSFFAIHIFKMTRIRIIGILLIMGWLLVKKKKVKEIVILTVLIIIVIGVLQVTMKENIILNLFSSAVTDVSESTGTWDEREVKGDIAIREFMKNPIFGSGLLTLSVKKENVSSAVYEKIMTTRDMSDLGYLNWLKAFGMVGMLWLVLFIFTILLIAYKAVKISEGREKIIAICGLSYFCFVVFTYITLPNFHIPRGIIYICLISAIVSRVVWNKNSINRNITEVSN